MHLNSASLWSHGSLACVCDAQHLRISRRVLLSVGMAAWILARNATAASRARSNSALASRKTNPSAHRGQAVKVRMLTQILPSISLLVRWSSALLLQGFRLHVWHRTIRAQDSAARIALQSPHALVILAIQHNICGNCNSRLWLASLCPIILSFKLISNAIILFVHVIVQRNETQYAQGFDRLALHATRATQCNCSGVLHLC